jgi:hypothetical protein
MEELSQLVSLPVGKSNLEENQMAAQVFLLNRDHQRRKKPLIFPILIENTGCHHETISHGVTLHS